MKRRRLLTRAALVAVSAVACLVLSHRWHTDVSADSLAFAPSGSAPSGSAPSGQLGGPDSAPAVSPAVSPADSLGRSAGHSTASVRLPGEFEPQQALLLAAGMWDMVFPGTLEKVIAATWENVDLVGIIPDESRRAELLDRLKAHGLPAESLRIVTIPHNTPWIRDYGPIVVQRGSGGDQAIVDLQYEIIAMPKGMNPTGAARTLDEEVPSRLAPVFRLPVLQSSLVLEGGNLLSNGRDVCVTTTRTLEYNREQQADGAVVEAVFRRYFGAATTCFLESLDSENTGHVDMFATFTAPDTVVVGSYHPAEDPVNAALLDRNAEKLASLKTSSGPLRVVRIPMPPCDDGLFRTYTNVIYANGTLLVPTYPGLDPAGEEQALETYRELLPGWRVIGIDVTDMIRRGGGLHCLATNVPAGDHRSLARRPLSNRVSLNN